MMTFFSKKSEQITEDFFVNLVAGDLFGLLSWEEFDRVCEFITQNLGKGWYLYTLSESPPQQAATNDELNDFILSLNKGIHKNYAREHCGIAYVDSITSPTLIKVFDPKLLKSICNIYGSPSLHGWVISRQKPIDVHANVINLNSESRKNKKLKTSNILDARKTGCPLPIINTCRALLSLSKGEILEIMTNEPGSVKDVSIICEKTGDKLVANNQTRDGFSFFVEKM